MKNELSREISRLTSAQRRVDALWGLAWAGCVALTLMLLLTVLARLIPLWYRADMVLAGIWLMGGGMVLGCVLGYAWPRAIARRLRHFDRRLHLADRLTTAWELQHGDIAAPDTMMQLQYAETLHAVRGADVGGAFPLRLPRWMWSVWLGLGLTLLPALMLPNPQEITLANLEAQKAATVIAAEKLAVARETLLENPALDEAARDAALQALDEALKTLQERRSTPAARQAALTEAEQRLAQLRAPEAEMQVQRLAESAPLSTERVVQPLTEALQRGDVTSAAAYLRALTDPLTLEELQALADAFAEMADNLQATDPELAQQFRDISQEIYQGQGASEAVEQAADALSQVAQANAPSEAVEQAQASVQQAQQQMQESNSAQQGPASSDAQAPSSAGNQGQSGGQGQTGSQTSSGNGATSGHSEDAGSSAPYGDTAPRLGETGGEITLPRPETIGERRPELGVPNLARVPYRDAYADYVEAAEAELSRHAYPPSLRGYVREYFGGLDP